MARLERRHATPSTRSSRWGASPRMKLVFVAVAFVSFSVSEIMHALLVPDIGRHGERLLAEGISAVIVALLAAKLVHAANQRREAALLRMHVISEMNHHTRNALQAICLTAESTQNQQCIRVISESVDRIEWALREILLRRIPLQEIERDRGYFPKKQSTAANARQENTNEHR